MAKLFSHMQRLGRALMLPIAVLPVAGMLLRLGQPDLLNVKIVAQAGQAIFDGLPMLFAIGVAVGFATDNHGVAGLAGAVGWFVFTAVLKAIDPKNDMGVLAGVVCGALGGLLYNRFKDLKLPEYLAFFAGKRFVAIATGLACLASGAVLGVVWPVARTGIDTVGHWLIGSGGVGLFLYGVLNRVLFVAGLHHILNSLVWFVFGQYGVGDHVVSGDLNRFFAGDPSAGGFMSGFFPPLMFGLPAACLAMYHAAPRERRKSVRGFYLSTALTSLLTGVSEPVDFTYLFLAPPLFVFNALATGLSMVLMPALGARMGFTFSAGAIDYALSYGLAQRAWILFPVGVVYAVVYYAVFRFYIQWRNVLTPGREPLTESADDGAGVPTTDAERAVAFVRALGGAKNLLHVDACTTRLRLTVGDAAAIDDVALKRLGGKGIFRASGGNVQVVLGPEADAVAETIRRAVGATAASAPGPAPAPRPVPAGPAGWAPVDAAAWSAALGGSSNVRAIEPIATTRMRVEVVDAARVDDEALGRLGAAGVARLSPTLVHVVVTQPGKAAAVADALALAP